MSLELTTRKSYKFFTTAKKLAKLLTLNVSTKILVNVVAITQIKIDHSKSYVKMIVGTDDPNSISRGGAGDPANPNPLLNNKNQNRQFRKNLRCLNIKWTKQEAIQIFNVQEVTGTPGRYRIFWTSLYCQNIPIDSFYSGEWALSPNLTTCQCTDGQSQFKSEVVSCFIEVPPKYLKKALEILSKITFPFDDSTLCINPSNVDCSSC